MLDDLSRDVYSILGIPIDAIGMQPYLHLIEIAAARKEPFLISTPNLNFLVNSQSDPEFRESMIQSDLCAADGMPIIWIARIIGVPIKNRIAGSDIFEALRAMPKSTKPLKVFLFGGAEGIAAKACRAINAQPCGLRCVGSFYPGFGPVDGMSSDDIIEKINSSGANFLVVSLGAKKGQAWLLRNHHRLLIPVRAHLGAVINFQAAVVTRAPLVLRKLSLEWLWRIKQEPHLWRRYWIDGGALLRLLFTRVLPLTLRMWWLRVKYTAEGQDFVVNRSNDDDSVTLRLCGPATVRHVDKIIVAFRRAIADQKRMVIDFSATSIVDARFFGLLLMLRKKLKENEASLMCIGLSPELKSLFRLNGLEFLLSLDKGA